MSSNLSYYNNFSSNASESIKKIVYNEYRGRKSQKRVSPFFYVKRVERNHKWRKTATIWRKTRKAAKRGGSCSIDVSRSGWGFQPVFLICSKGTARIGIRSRLRGTSSWRFRQFYRRGAAVVRRWWVASPLDQGLGYDIIGEGLTSFAPDWQSETSGDC